MKFCLEGNDYSLEPFLVLSSEFLFIYKGIQKFLSISLRTYLFKYLYFTRH